MWAFVAAFLGGFRGLFQALLGAGRGFLGASVQVVHKHTKVTLFRLFGAIAFARSFKKSVLRAFLGGLFGFMGARCGFGWLVAFVGFVGLYACSVRRLRTEKRIAAHFLGLLRSFSFLYCCCFACLDCFAPVLCLLWLGCWCFFFPSDGMTKRNGAQCWCVLSSWVIRLLYV